MTGDRRKLQRRSPGDHFKFLQQSFLDRTFQWFEKNVLATDQAHADSTVRRRIIVLSVISLLGSVTLIIFGSLAFIQNARVLGLVDFIFAFAFILNLYKARTKKNYQLNILVGITLAMCLYGLIYLNGGVNQTAYVWYYTFPFMASFLLGSKNGAIAMVAMTIPVIALMILDPKHLFFAQYDLQFEFRFLCSYLLVGIFSYFFEKASENSREEILAINKTLEDRVQSRTAELTLLNKQLREEVGQHKHARMMLEESESKFRTLIDLAAVGILLGSNDGVITDANRSMCEIFGMHREDLIDLHISQLPFTQESLATSPLRFDLLQSGEKVVSDRRISRLDGSEAAIEMQTIMMPDGTYQSIFRDITERLQVELELRDSEERFRTLHNASFGGIVIHDQGLILDCNQGLSDMTGYSRDELIGMDGLELLAPQWRDLVRQNIQNQYTKPYEVEAVRKDGIILPISIRGSMIPYKGRTARVTEFRDISAQKEAAEEKLKLEEQLFQAQKMETIGQLAGGVAHDFNNMLGVIIGYSEMAMMKLDSSTPLFNDLTKIRKAADRSAEITRQLLAFARKQTVEPTILDLNETVEGMLQMIRRLIGEDIKLIWLPGDDLWRVKMDASQIDQILVNLCVNARDAISGVGELIVELENCTLEEKDYTDTGVSIPLEYVRLSVSDNGCGMSEETLHHAFEPFFTTKGVGVGTGLGLATVYGAVKQNNGTVKVSSTLRKGTTIEIYIPRYSGKGQDKPAEPAAEGNVPGSETILIVEDEETILDLARAMLENLGYQVLTTISPPQAIELTESFTDRIHLFLLDVIMPEINGRDLAQELLAIKPEARCLYMSGYTADIIASQGLLDEGVELLQKPFSQQDLAAKVRQSLDKKITA
jgi:two-component system cell cycle sensor histidine kinase/response regulator CckA